MTSFSNPAGRLHAMLLKYHESRTAHSGNAMSTLWQVALNAENVPVEMSRVAGLLAEVSDAADTVEGPAQETARELLRLHLREWSSPILFPPVGADQGVTDPHGYVSDSAMGSLAALSTILDLAAPEGRDVPEDVRRSLREEVDSLILQIRDDSDLAPSLKSVILRRLHDIASAIDEYAIMGPGGLLAATDRLIVAVVLESGNDSTLKKRLAPFMEFSRKIYGVASFIGTAHGAVEAITATAVALGISS